MKAPLIIKEQSEENTNYLIINLLNILKIELDNILYVSSKLPEYHGSGT